MTAARQAARSVRIGFIGAGQLATPIAWALAIKGFDVVGASSRSLPSAQRLAGGIAGARAFAAPQDLVDTAELIIIAVPDDYIASVVGQVAWQKRHWVVHCSGATEVSALAPAADAGAATGGFHPLQSFTAPEAAMRTLPGCTIAIEAEEPLLGWLTETAGALGCHPVRLPPGARTLYHAAGSLVSPGLVTLLNEAIELWSAFGIAPADAVRALLPLIHGTLAALEAHGPVRALSGPVARGDAGTIARHISALRSHAPDVLPCYQELIRCALPIAAAKGSATPESLAKLRRLLQ